MNTVTVPYDLLMEILDDAENNSNQVESEWGGRNSNNDDEIGKIEELRKIADNSKSTTSSV